MHLVEVERLQEVKDLHVLAASRPARARLHQPAKRVERLGQFPAGQRRRLVQRAEFLPEQRQIVQGVKHHAMVARLNRAMHSWANYFVLRQVSPAYRAIDQHASRRQRQ